MQRPLLLLAIALVLAGSVRAQDEGGWIAPYPQLPEYRERLGRLFDEGAPSRGRIPDITWRGVVAAGVFRQDARPGELLAAYATLTYSRDANQLALFTDLRVVVRDVTQVRVGEGAGAAAFLRRTGHPTPAFQACVDAQMVLRMYHLDARWRSVTECEDRLSWSAWTAGASGGGALSLDPRTASDYRWLQPYAELPEYREYAGRLFGETAAANEERRLDNITTPAALAAGSFKSRARPGDTIAYYGVHFFNLDANNQRDIPNLRMVVKDLVEVRFLLAGTQGVNFDVRKGVGTRRHQECLELRLPRLMYLPDARWRAMAQCEPTAAWSWWVRDSPRPFSGSFSVDRITTLDYAWDAAAGELRLSLR